jgi:predicted ABC-type transport system involved in lysophospholipase L1 biosynthesis ATPase subunit
VTLLSLNDVSKRFLDGAREILVLDRVSVEIDAGDLIGIYGEQRSGKSILLEVAAGLEVPDAGTVSFAGNEITRLSTSERAHFRRPHGMALAGGDWRPVGISQPVLEHVALPLTTDGLTLAESEAVARPVLDRFGLTQWAHTSTERLSVSERIRVELARAIVREPQLLFVDEPSVLSGLNDSRELYALLRSFARDSGIAVVIASEDMSALEGVQRFMTIDGGRLRSTESRRRVLPFPERRSQGGNGPQAS